MRTPSQGFALGLGYDPWDVQAARESSFPGNPVTDVEAGQHREDPFGVSVQHL